jgi:hypothetical protein
MLMIEMRLEGLRDPELGTITPLDYKLQVMIKL